MGVERLNENGAREGAHFNQTPNTVATTPGVRRRAIMFGVERETAQTAG